MTATGVTACGADDPSPAPARPAVSPAPGDHTLHLDWQGVERNYELHAPPGYRPGVAVPLVVALHGRPSSAAKLRAASGLDKVADREGFLTAYPNGIDGAWQATGGVGAVDDVGFLRAMVEHLVKTWGVDPRRVYATGFSDGARMSYELAVNASDVFAAIAPVSGPFEWGRARSDTGYKPAEPVSVVAFLGSRDRIADQISYGLSRWYRHLGCTADEPVWIDKDRTVNRTVAKCADGSEAVDYVVNGMGHSWPAPTDRAAAIDAGVVMWEFFAAHRRG
ncbi:PHB depolymerase family esterase [Micromonospora sp. WMMD1102]|uniref:alpha/beta hydrolase family esterase n=1 Tax=Micromonospora sp. WMMD1102 TaxID=3016105 RepID=UPI0024152A14|nr:PHB depolymerase family esterase [Micromonospora sp. WMMD1102]MDG4789998.1 PHB depolymerase family esterase [Micromonospora sp. WMMD1102]